MTESQGTKRIDKLLHAYFFAKQYVIKQGYAAEIDWQGRVSFQEITGKELLREAAWVILSTGLSAKVVSTKFNSLASVFFNWNLNRIVLNKDQCRKAALSLFNNYRKIDAIIYFAERVHKIGIDILKNRIETDGLSYFDDFPFMGPATKCHLAKNIGLNVAKPDRHLVRIARKAGYSTPHEMCEILANEVDEKISVIDLVVWRYATIKRDYIAKLTRYLNRSN